jgi:hypothetical protein
MNSPQTRHLIAEHPVTGLRSVTYTQALGIFFLCLIVYSLKMAE